MQAYAKSFVLNKEFQHHSSGQHDVSENHLLPEVPRFTEQYDIEPDKLIRFSMDLNRLREIQSESKGKIKYLNKIVPKEGGSSYSKFNNK